MQGLGLFMFSHKFSNSPQYNTLPRLLFSMSPLAFFGWFCVPCSLKLLISSVAQLFAVATACESSSVIDYISSVNDFWTTNGYWKCQASFITGRNTSHRISAGFYSLIEFWAQLFRGRSSLELWKILLFLQKLECYIDCWKQ